MFEEDKQNKIFGRRKGKNLSNLQKENLNRWMVRKGYAVAYRKYSKDYVRDEIYAKENKFGMWRGTFVEPEQWRRKNK